MAYYYTNGKSCEEWTFFKSLLLILLSVIVLLVFIMLVNNYDVYDRATKVLSWIWSAGTAILGSLGIVRKKRMSLSEFIGLRPTKMFIIIYAGITFIFFLFAELPSHCVCITATLNGKPLENVNIEWDRNERKTNAGGKLRVCCVQRGKHFLVASYGCYKTRSDTVEVALWPMKFYGIDWDSTDIAYGQLTISSIPESGARITIDRIESEYSTNTTMDSIKPGAHTLELNKKKGKGRYYAKIDILVGESQSCTLTVQLLFIPSPRGEITIVSEPPGADIYICGRYMERQTPATIELDSGSYELELRKKETNDYGFVYEQKISIKTAIARKPLGTVDLRKHVRRLRPLYIYSKPKAHIFVKGRYEGQTNALEPIYLFKGTYDQITLREYGYYDEPVQAGDLPCTDIISLRKVID